MSPEAVRALAKLRHLYDHLRLGRVRGPHQSEAVARVLIPIIEALERCCERQCLVTGNQCGTDTRSIDDPCGCTNCRREARQPRPHFMTDEWEFKVASPDLPEVGAGHSLPEPDGDFRLRE